jgi:hypothetical protein
MFCAYSSLDGSQLTEGPAVSEYFDALLLDEELNGDFKNLLATGLMTAAREFQTFMPSLVRKTVVATFPK